MILANDQDAMDPVLVGSVARLKSRGAHRCWHKHSTFLDHLLGVHHILRLWGQGRTIGRVGLLHSVYSNSYVNLALFDPSLETERALVRDMAGTAAEELVHLFCIVNRQSIVVDTLLHQGFIPPDGLHVPHLHQNDTTVHLSPETLRMLLVFTMADIAEQNFGWQDRLFGGRDMVNSMFLPKEDPNQHDTTAMWPGMSQPGLWMSYISQLGAVARTFEPSNNNKNQDNETVCNNKNDDDQRTTDIPPVFDNCTKTISRQDEAIARDLYWKVVMEEVREPEQVLQTLQECIEHNPWVFEPHVVLAQHYLHRNEYRLAKQAASRALELQTQWGTGWDKRLSFPAWVAWTRVMLQRATQEIPWPTNSWDVINFGLVG